MRGGLTRDVLGDADRVDVRLDDPVRRRPGALGDVGELAVFGHVAAVHEGRRIEGVRPLQGWEIHLCPELIDRAEHPPLTRHIALLGGRGERREGHEKRQGEQCEQSSGA